MSTGNNQIPKPPLNPVPAAEQPVFVSEENPGQIFGILSLASVPLGLSLVGIILGYIGRKKSREAGQDASLSTIGLVTCLILTVATILLFAIPIILFVLFSAFFFNIT